MIVVATLAMALLGMLIARSWCCRCARAPALNTLLITLMLGTVLREARAAVLSAGRQSEAVSGAAADQLRSISAPSICGSTMC